MRSNSVEDALLSYLNISDIFNPRLWITDYFDLLTNEIDIITETCLAKAQSDGGRIKALNDMRRLVLDKIATCHMFNLKVFDNTSLDEFDYLQDLYERVLEMIKVHASRSFAIADMRVVYENLIGSEPEFEREIHDLLSRVFAKFCFLVKESDLSTSVAETTTPDVMQYLYMTDFYVSKSGLRYSNA